MQVRMYTFRNIYSDIDMQYKLQSGLYILLMPSIENDDSGCNRSFQQHLGLAQNANDTCRDGHWMYFSFVNGFV